MWHQNYLHKVTTLLTICEGFFTKLLCLQTDSKVVCFEQAHTQSKDSMLVRSCGTPLSIPHNMRGIDNRLTHSDFNCHGDLNGIQCTYCGSRVPKKIFKNLKNVGSIKLSSHWGRNSNYQMHFLVIELYPFFVSLI